MLRMTQGRNFILPCIPAPPSSTPFIFSFWLLFLFDVKITNAAYSIYKLKKYLFNCVCAQFVDTFSGSNGVKVLNFLVSLQNKNVFTYLKMSQCHRQTFHWAKDCVELNLLPGQVRISCRLQSIGHPWSPYSLIAKM